jgi:hypothetical protein
MARPLKIDMCGERGQHLQQLLKQLGMRSPINRT